jgi:hypothetical protein
LGLVLLFFGVRVWNTERTVTGIVCLRGTLGIVGSGGVRLASFSSPLTLEVLAVAGGGIVTAQLFEDIDALLVMERGVEHR